MFAQKLRDLSSFWADTQVLSFHSNKEIIEADKDKINQVLTNLVSNALKYTNLGGTIEINVSKSETAIEISVKDNGNGIPEEDLPYIFERFYRADKSRNRLTGGTGLGLTIAKAIIEAHNGKITVKSELNKESPSRCNDSPLSKGSGA